MANAISTHFYRKSCKKIHCIKARETVGSIGEKYRYKYWYPYQQWVTQMHQNGIPDRDTRGITMVKDLRMTETMGRRTVKAFSTLQTSKECFVEHPRIVEVFQGIGPRHCREIGQR
jgi:hypothetical protein